jgi:PhnB protein
MPVTQLTPYLNFAGTAAAAIDRYVSVFGAKVHGIQRYGEVPGMTAAAEHEQLVMHCELRIDGLPLFLCDGPPGRQITSGDNAHVSLSFVDVEEMKAKFHALAAGGKVTMALGDTFWGAHFGMLTDQFGVRWMFSCDRAKEA